MRRAPPSVVVVLVIRSFIVIKVIVLGSMNTIGIIVIVVMLLSYCCYNCYNCHNYGYNHFLRLLYLLLFALLLFFSYYHRCHCYPQCSSYYSSQRYSYCFFQVMIHIIIYIIARPSMVILLYITILLLILILLSLLCILRLLLFLLLLLLQNSGGCHWAHAAFMGNRIHVSGSHSSLHFSLATLQCSAV